MTTRAGFIAVIGAPNAGKSTLVNTMVGAKVAIVTHKVQTTRARLLGIALHGDSQLIFVDTPGIFAPRRRLDRAMVQAAWRGAEDADLVVLVIDAAKGLDEEGERICGGLRRAGRRCLIALNKIDRVKKPALLALAERLGDMGIADEIFMVSAFKGEGVADLKAALADALPEGPWLFPEDQITDVTNRVLAAEITREKVYLRLHQELPYASSVLTETYGEQPDGSVRIEQLIVVERDSQKGIVIGKGGQTLKAIGAAARAELEALLECKVHLFIRVKVDKSWAERRSHYAEIGLDYVS